MFIALDALLQQDNNRQEYDMDVTFDRLDMKFGSYQLRQKSPVHLILFHSRGKRFTVTGKADFTFMIPCDRCLEDVEVDIPVSISKKFDLGKVSEAGEETEEEKYVTEQAQLRVDLLLKDEILVSWPDKVLCKEDCKGLCPVCGHNLNVSDCGCDRFVPDPRMAAIQDIFKNAGDK